MIALYFESENGTQFDTAILDSKRIHLGPHRKLSYRAMVQGNGNIVIGKAYTAMMDLDPGDEFDIKLGKNDIRLTRVVGGERLI